jgi:hypothetical protein
VLHADTGILAIFNLGSCRFAKVESFTFARSLGLRKVSRSIALTTLLEVDVYTSSYATPANSGMMSCLYSWRPSPAVASLVSSHPSVIRRPVQISCDAALATMFGVIMASLCSPSSRPPGVPTQTRLGLGSSSHGVSKMARELGDLTR